MDVLSDEPQILQPFSAPGREIKGESERQTSEGEEKRGREQDVESQAGTSLY